MEQTLPPMIALIKQFMITITCGFVERLTGRETVYVQQYVAANVFDFLFSNYQILTLTGTVLTFTCLILPLYIMINFNNILCGIKQVILNNDTFCNTVILYLKTCCKCT